MIIQLFLRSLLDDWKPEPLVPEQPEKVVDEERIIDGSNGLVISVNGSECLNFGSYNFLNLLGHATIKETAKEAIKTYGVGSCGPRGFFGTFDAHLDLESKARVRSGRLVKVTSIISTPGSSWPSFWASKRQYSIRTAFRQLPRRFRPMRKRAM